MLVRFTNPDLCALTEQVIFSDPYAQAAMNRWTSPQLDEAAAGLRADAEAKVAVSVLKRKFCSSADALIHGDLHTGSIMVSSGLSGDTGVVSCWTANDIVADNCVSCYG
jgi:5-methylthioribose kinase